jgi:hypothetical protein
MSVWASRRKATYIGTFVMIIAALAAIPVYQSLQVEPTCFDGRQNQGEAGVDCGGPCALLCEFQVGPLQLLWSRSFPVTSRYWNAVAYIENPNLDAGVITVPYMFQLYDSDNVLITERRGTTFISNNGITPIFESRIDVGNRRPVRTFFRFEGAMPYRSLTRPREVTIEDQRVVRADVEPRVEARIRNSTLHDVRDIEVVAVVFNVEGNAIAVSQTVVPLLEQQSAQTIFFVWPQPFSETVGRVDIIPRIPPTEQL